MLTLPLCTSRNSKVGRGSHVIRILQEIARNWAIIKELLALSTNFKHFGADGKGLLQLRHPMFLFMKKIQKYSNITDKYRIEKTNGTVSTSYLFFSFKTMMVKQSAKTLCLTKRPITSTTIANRSTVCLYFGGLPGNGRSQSKLNWKWYKELWLMWLNGSLFESLVLH